MKLRMRLLWLVALLCAMPASAQDNALPQPTITLYVTVDWEGLSLDEENLEAIREFRRTYPHIAMLHLLNPVYFLQPGINTADTTAKIRSVLLPGDEHGLHLHGWKSLVEYCKVEYKSEPSFAGAAEQCEDGSCGYAVSLEYAYSQYELATLVGCSADLLVKRGFDRPRSFRAGGWQLGPKLAVALLDNGFVFDSSRTVPQLVANRWGETSNLMQMVKVLHADGSILDQPYELLPGLMEYPNNASLADYTSTDQLLEIFRTLLVSGKTVMVLGFHQESAFNYLNRLADAIPRMQQEADATGVRLEWAQYR